jgi:GNAT superfamily N-acetyltransferase
MTPPDAVTIRPATMADLPVIVGMRNRLNQLEYSGCPHASIQPLSLAEFTELWGGTLDGPDHCWRVVEVHGQVVGFGLIYLLTPKIPRSAAYIQWTYLEPDHRRKRIGEDLVSELMRWAYQKKASRVELQFIDGNVAAEQFWTASRGFRPFARKCVYYFRAEPGED